MRFFILFLLLFSKNTTVFAQNNDTLKKLTIGIEQDVLPYLLKGFIGTVWLGKGNSRYRLSYAQATAPKFFIGKDLISDKVKAVGLSYEYFFKDDFKGLWLGPGLGFWQNDVTFENGITTKNKSFILTLGSGYNISLSNWLYVSPWVALHTRLTGTNEVNAFYQSYKPAILTPEVSFKVGVKF
jgi:hypothetical protein